MELRVSEMWQDRTGLQSIYVQRSIDIFMKHAGFPWNPNNPKWHLSNMGLCKGDVDILISCLKKRDIARDAAEGNVTFLRATNIHIS
jgi:hypothetical protein